MPLINKIMTFNFERLPLSIGRVCIKLSWSYLNDMNFLVLFFCVGSGCTILFSRNLS